MSNLEKINELIAVLNIDNVEIERDEIGTWLLCNGKRVLIGGETYDRVKEISDCQGCFEIGYTREFGVVGKFRRENFGITFPTFEVIE